MNASRYRVLLSVLAPLILAAQAMCENSASPHGDPAAEAPTLTCLGVYWVIQGDDNRNARVEADYRPAGRHEWTPAPDLFRVAKIRSQPSKHPSKIDIPVDCWLFAGSVFRVKSGTKYEARLRLIDPDGGEAVKTVACATRPEPVIPDGLKRLHVIPGEGGGSGTADDPFAGLDEALRHAQAGTVFLLHKGTYRPAVEIASSGQDGKPIIFMSAGDGEAVIDSRGRSRGIVCEGQSHLWFEGLTVINAEYGLVAKDAADIVIRRCVFRQCASGIWATATIKNDDGRMTGFVISDNVFEGTHNWTQAKGAAGEEHRAVNITGSGHSICYNRISGFKDGVDTFQSSEVSAIDIHNNEISECLDDGSEMDFSDRNTRNFDNRYTNVHQGVSIQPIFGGPVYVMRNVLYNVGVEPFKMHNGPSGGLFIHNTVVKAGPPTGVFSTNPVHNCVMRNNLFLGSAGPFAADFTPKMQECDFDYDGFGGGPWGGFLQWNGLQYKSLTEARSRSGIYRHARLIDAAKAFASGLAIPTSFQKKADPAKIDLRPAANSGAIDAGEPIRGINDDFAGKAPDLGACEFGQEPIHYGPRRTGE